MFFCVTLEIPKLSKIMLLNSLKVSVLRKFFCEREELWTGCQLWIIVLLSYSSLQITVVGVSCAWLVVAVMLCWEEISWRYFRVGDDSFVIWYLTFHKVNYPVSKKRQAYSKTFLFGDSIVLLSCCWSVGVKCHRLIILQERSTNANTRCIHLKGFEQLLIEIITDWIGTKQGLEQWVS